MRLPLPTLYRVLSNLPSLQALKECAALGSLAATYGEVEPDGPPSTD